MQWPFVKLLALVVLLQCAGIADHSLWTPDEPREAQIVREMSLAGDYLIPRLAGNAFLEKPPLYYLASAASYTLLGDRFPEAGRVASLVFALGTLLVVWLTARRLYSDRDALPAPLILATFPLFFVSSHRIIVDMGLVFFITTAMCSFLIAWRERSRTLYRVFWVSLACSFLCKGIIGLAIPGAGLLLFVLWHHDTGFLRDAWVPQGVLLVLAVIAAWAGVLYMRGGYGYLHTFFVYNQIGRFIPAGIVYGGGHVKPFYYYLYNIPLQTAPFSLLLIPAAAYARKAGASERFLFSWLLGGLLVLSLASTKREIYFLPMLPAMALLIAWWESRPGDSRQPWEDRLMKAVSGLVAACSLALPAAYVAIGGSLAVAGLAVSALCVLFRIVWVRFRALHFMPVLLGWTLLLLVWTPVVIPQLDKGKSYRGMFEELGRIVSHSEVIGYRLTETVEALGPFYGQFAVKNIEDRLVFIDIMKRREAGYIIVLPGRMDEGLWRELGSCAVPAYRGGGGMRREIELWKMSSYP